MEGKSILLNERELKVFGLKQDKYLSKHTGKELLEIHFTCDFQGEEEHKWFLEVLNSKVIKLKISPTSEATQDFTRGETSYSYSSSYRGEPAIYSHSVTLKEKEKIDVKRIKINDLIIEPYKYEEDDSSETQISINLKSNISEEQRQKIIQMFYEGKEYLEVIREGIDKQARKMRFGLPKWSKEKDGALYKYYLILIDYVPDEREFPIPNKLIVDNLAIQAVKLKMIVDKLIRKLIEIKLIDGKEMEMDLENKIEWKKFSEIHHDLFRVENLEKEE